MKNTLQFCTLLILFTFVFCYSALAQRGTTITGTAVIYGSGFNTRTITKPFTLTVNGRTSDRETASYLDTLQVRGQDALMQQMGSRSLGRFSFTGSVGEPLKCGLCRTDRRRHSYSRCISTVGRIRRDPPRPPLSRLSFQLC